MSYKLVDRNGVIVAEFPDMVDLGTVRVDSVSVGIKGHGVAQMLQYMLDDEHYLIYPKHRQMLEDIIKHLKSEDG